MKAKQAGMPNQRIGNVTSKGRGFNKKKSCCYLTTEIIYIEREYNIQIIWKSNEYAIVQKRKLLAYESLLLF